MSKLVKNTSLYTIGNILPSAAGFFLLPIYTRYLTPSDYGIVSSMQVLSTILAIIFTLAVERSVYRLYWDHKTEDEKRDYLGTIVIALAPIAAFILILLFLFQSLVGSIYASIPFYPFYVYAILTSFFSVFARVPKIYLQLEQKAGKFVILSILQFVVDTTLVLWFVVRMKAGAEGMLKGHMVGHALMLIIFLYMTCKVIHLTFKPWMLKGSLKFSLPMIPSLLCAWVLNLSDRIFIERYLSLSDVGIYSLGYKIAGLVLIITGAFGMAYNPVFYQLANSEDQVAAKRTLYSYNNIYVMVILLVCFLVSFFSKEVIVLLLDPRFAEAYKIVPIIALAYFISIGASLLNLSIYQEKKTVAIMFIQIFGASLNIALNFLLVPNFGAYGAAYATVLSFTAILICKYLYAKKCYFIDYDWNKIIMGLLLAVPLVSTVYFIDINIYLSLFVKLFIVACVSLFLYAPFRVQVKSMLGVKETV
ncbi:MAG: oligosaccharide flippase family protein [Alphaproteobacteria bacterium]|nr:oligosaccharide flippase family protein [Alphaproteobacteria bacterium]